MGDVDAYQQAEEEVEQRRDEQARDAKDAQRADLAAEPVKATAAHGRLSAELPLGLIKAAANMRTGELPEIQGLAISIREVGLISPLLVRLTAEGDYRLVAGRRRLAALVLVHDGDPQALVRCEVIDSDTDESEAWILMLTENLQREDPPPLEVARGLRAALRLDPELSASALARSLGKSPAWASRHLHLLDLPEKVQWRLEEGDLNFTIADLIRQGEKKGIITDDEDADRIAEAMVSGDMDVDGLKKLVRPRPVMHPVPENYEQISRDLDAARYGAGERGFEPSEKMADEQRDWEEGNDVSATAHHQPKATVSTVSAAAELLGDRQLDSYLIGRLLRDHASAQLRAQLGVEPEKTFEYAWALGTAEDRTRVLREIAVDLVDADDELPRVIFSRR